MPEKSIFHEPHNTSRKILNLETGETQGVNKKLSEQ